MHAHAWNRSQAKEWIGERENELAKFIGYESRLARLISLVETTQRMGFTDAPTACRLLDDSYAIADLCRIGRRNTGLLRSPTPELEILLMTMGRET